MAWLLCHGHCRVSGRFKSNNLVGAWREKRIKVLMTLLHFDDWWWLIPLKLIKATRGVDVSCSFVDCAYWMVQSLISSDAKRRHRDARLNLKLRLVRGYKWRRFSLSVISSRHNYWNCETASSSCTNVHMMTTQALFDNGRAHPHMLHTHNAECQHVPACRRWPTKRS